MSRNVYQWARSKFVAVSRKEDRAQKLVEQGAVKGLFFQPSGRKLWFVVGDEGDHLVDDVTRFCTCPHFYFRTITKPTNVCAHLLALDIAVSNGRYEAIMISDDEYGTVLRLFLSDLLKRLSKEESSGEQG